MKIEIQLHKSRELISQISKACEKIQFNTFELVHVSLIVIFGILCLIPFMFHRL